jgi:hypothetical protein
MRPLFLAPDGRKQSRSGTTHSQVVAPGAPPATLSVVDGVSFFAGVEREEHESECRITLDGELFGASGRI